MDLFGGPDRLFQPLLGKKKLENLKKVRISIINLTFFDNHLSFQSFFL